MITIKEIAEKAGVTTTTVSNVINGRTDKVSADVEKKIQQILKENNYIPRFGLNALTNRKSKIIGVLVNTPTFVEHTAYERPFYGASIGTLESELRKMGYYIMLYSSKDMEEIMRMILGWNIDGIITISMPKKYHEQIKEKTKKPIVAIDMILDKNEIVGKLHNVTLKDYQAGQTIMKHLIERGIEEIIYAVNVMKGSDYRRYKGAFDKYNEAFGNNDKFELIILEDTLDKRHKQYKSMTKLIGRKGCVQFSTDLNALEAIGYFTQNNIHVPKDISITGFDDDIYAALCVPGITTMKSNSINKAKQASKMLVSLIKGKNIPQNNLELNSHIVKRKSVI